MTCDKFKNMKQKKNILKSKTKQGGTQIKKNSLVNALTRWRNKINMHYEGSIQ